MSPPDFLDDLQTGKYGPGVLEQTRLYLVAYNSIFGDRVPTKAGLGRVLCVSKQTLYRWQDQYIEFRELIDQMMLEKERQLVNYGLIGVFNSTMAKLALVEHGYADKSVVDLNTDVTDLTDEQLDYVVKYGRLPDTA